MIELLRPYVTYNLIVAVGLPLAFSLPVLALFSFMAQHSRGRRRVK